MKIQWSLGVGISVLTLGYMLSKKINKLVNGKVAIVSNENIVIEKSSKVSLDKYIDEIKVNGYMLEGLYESTYRAVYDDVDEETVETLLFSWETRLDEEYFQCLFKKWNVIKNFNVDETKILNLDRWLIFLEEVGVERINEKNHLVDEKSFKKYDIPDCVMGELIGVLKAYWAIDDIILEKGICEL